METRDNDYIYRVKGLHTVFHTLDGDVVAVDDVSYEVRRGEIIGIVGESGCGKSVTNFSALQLLKMPPAEIEQGEALFDGQDLLKMKKNSRELRDIRGDKVSIIFQEPIMSLNPVLTVGDQIEETIRLHLKLGRKEARERAMEMLRLVGIPDVEQRINYYPHQFSGGMCQRVMIAMAIACDPEVLIADEATTALDVTTQEQILDLLKEIADKLHTAIILVTHNLGVVARYAQRIYVMYAGHVVETGPTDEIFKTPLHPYTLGLLHAVPKLDMDKDVRLIPIDGAPPRLINKPNHCDFCVRCPFANDACREKPYPETVQLAPERRVACHRYQEITELHNQRRSERVAPNSVDRTGEPLLRVENLEFAYPGAKTFFHKSPDVKILDRINFDLYPGETLGLVGESGCGKSTVANCVMRFLKPTGGRIVFDGNDITSISEREMWKYRKDIQIVSQNPFASMDPRQSVGSVLAEPRVVHKVCASRAERDARVQELMEMVGLDPMMKDRMPHEFSGGQRQRICIARALALRPKLLICDEPISALDVSIQAQIINLFRSLQQQLDLSYLFIAHDLSVVRHISDRIAVMYLGQVVEFADWKSLYDDPKHPYTRALISAVPTPDPELERTRERIRLSGEVTSVQNRIDGCNFSARCPHARPECRTTRPVLDSVSSEHTCACMRWREL